MITFSFLFNFLISPVASSGKNYECPFIAVRLIVSPI